MVSFQRYGEMYSCEICGARVGVVFGHSLGLICEGCLDVIDQDDDQDGSEIVHGTGIVPHVPRWGASSTRERIEKLRDSMH
jgi:hypothetical protein